MESVSAKARDAVLGRVVVSNHAFPNMCCMWQRMSQSKGSRLGRVLKIPGVLEVHNARASPGPPGREEATRLSLRHAKTLPKQD